VLEWRKSWFDSQPSEKNVVEWVHNFYSVLEEFLIEALTEYRLYLPQKPAYRISKNILLIPSEGKLRLERKGILLPAQLSGLGKPYFRIQNRFNRFELKLNIHRENIPSALEKRFHFEKKIVDYNKKFLPDFLPLTSSLHAV
jgi:hypothetical protein